MYPYCICFPWQRSTGTVRQYTVDQGVHSDESLGHTPLVETGNQHVSQTDPVHFEYKCLPHLKYSKLLKLHVIRFLFISTAISLRKWKSYAKVHVKCWFNEILLYDRFNIRLFSLNHLTFFILIYTQAEKWFQKIIHWLVSEYAV